MAIKHLPDGQDFGPEHFSKDFGFHGSAEHTAAPPFAAGKPTRGPKNVAEPMEQGGGDYAEGGHVAAPPYAADKPTRGPKHVPEPMETGGNDYAHGGHHVVRHPDGSHSVHHSDGRIEHHHAHGGHSVHHHDGTIVHHHAHGGHTVHHSDGSIVHHHPDGTQIHHHAHGGHSVHHPGGMVEHHHAHGGHTVHHPDGHVEHHDSSEYAHGGGHSDVAQDKAMIKNAFRQHETAEHGGEHHDLHLAKGGFAGERVRLPRGMRPAAHNMHDPIGSGALKSPARTPTPRNAGMPGGRMGYGVEPSAEPDIAGSDQTGLGGALGGMRRGGHRRG